MSSTIPLRAQALRRRRVRIETLRHLFQAGLALLVVAIGVQFVRWVHALETLGKGPASLVRRVSRGSCDAREGGTLEGDAR